MRATYRKIKNEKKKRKKKEKAIENQSEVVTQLSLKRNFTIKQTLFFLGVKYRKLMYFRKKENFITSLICAVVFSDCEKQRTGNSCFLAKRNSNKYLYGLQITRRFYLAAKMQIFFSSLVFIFMQI